MKKTLITMLLVIACCFAFGQNSAYETLSNIPYYPDSVNQSDDYVAERCVLDIYYPTGIKNYATIVWFHGGGLTGGNKRIPEALKGKGMAIIAVNYRLYPKIKAPVYIEDAAAAVAWTFKNIKDYGGDPGLIFISGHSAGGYLASMVGLDKRWLRIHNIDANRIAGLIPFSGHTITHFTVRRERGLKNTQPIVDDLAPLYHVRPDAPPLLLITGDRELELLGRYEENAYLMRMMKVAGHQDTRIMELDGYGHGMAQPAFPILVKEVRRIIAELTRPNIVLIIADDASWKHFGAYGSDELSTPNIDKLAKEGVVFENAFVSTSSCSPSRAAILTGRNSFELEEGATLWGYLPAKFQTYTELLAERGYRTGFTGKGWGPGFEVDRISNPAGISYNMITHEPYKEKFEQVAISNIDYAANFESFLKTSNSEDPFCFWIGTYEPHRGYTPGVATSEGINCENVSVPGFMPDASRVREDICEYYAEIEHIDQQVGEVMEALERQNKLENTLILITSDNGMPFPRAKATLYDYGTHVPLIAWWGNKITGGRRVSDLISYTDIAPTFLEAAGMSKPWGMSGKSFFPLLKSDTSGQIDPDRTKVYLARERHVLFPGSDGQTTPARAIRTNEHLLIWNIQTGMPYRDVDGGPAKTFMEENHKEFNRLYELSFGLRPEYELYHIPTDPFQLNNLAEDVKHIEELEQLKSDLFSYLKKRNDPRMSENEDAYKYNPYFGRIFQTGLLKWQEREDWKNFSNEKKISILKKSYSMIGEEALFDKMIAKQNGKL